MRHEVLGKCPVCDNDIHITEIHCNKCETFIRGEFELCEVFVKNRGNIKELEKELGISYPTVRNKLDEVIAALGYQVEQQKSGVSRKEILDKLGRGEINKEEALKLLSE